MSCPASTLVFVFPLTTGAEYPTGRIVVGGNSANIVDGLAVLPGITQLLEVPFEIHLNQNFKVNHLIVGAIPLANNLTGVYPMPGTIIRDYNGITFIEWTALPGTNTCWPSEQANFYIEIQGEITTEPPTPPPVAPGAFPFMPLLLLLGLAAALLQWRGD